MINRLDFILLMLVAISSFGRGGESGGEVVVSSSLGIPGRLQ